MKRALAGVGVIAGGIFLAGVVFFFWASSGTLAPEERTNTERYAPPRAAAADTLAVATYNIGYLSGMTNNEPVVRSERLFVENMDRAVSLLSRSVPEVLALQEVDFGAARSFYVHQLDTLAARIDFPIAAQAVNWDVQYLPFPYGRPAVHFGRVLSGQAVLSDHDIRAHRRYVLPAAPRPVYEAPFYLDRLVQAVLLDVGGRPLLILNVHFEAYDRSTREAQARAVRALYKTVERFSLPVVLLGDFNAEVSAPDDRTMDILLGGTDLRAVVPGRATFPADAPTRAIDHLLYRPSQMTPADAQVRCGAATHPPSDHCAVQASLVLSETTEAPPMDSVRAALPEAGGWAAGPSR